MKLDTKTMKNAEYAKLGKARFKEHKKTRT